LELEVIVDEMNQDYSSTLGELLKLGNIISVKSENDFLVACGLNLSLNDKTHGSIISQLYRKIKALKYKLRLAISV